MFTLGVIMMHEHLQACGSPRVQTSISITAGIAKGGIGALADGAVDPIALP